MNKKEKKMYCRINPKEKFYFDIIIIFEFEMSSRFSFCFCFCVLGKEVT